MDKNNRQYKKSVIRDHIARYGKEMQPTEIKTKRHMRRYVIMECGKRIAESYWNQVISGGPTYPGDMIPQGIMGELRKQQCKYAESEWRRKYGQKTT